MANASKPRYRGGVALTDEQAWTLTASGLVALADGVLKGGEAGRILGMVQESLAPDEQDQWMDLLSDVGALWQHARGLPRPPAGRVEELLRQAWSIALVDGDGSADEVRVLEQLADLLGVDRDRLTVWRKTWTVQASELAQYIAAFAALALHRRAAAAPDPMAEPGDAARAEFRALLARLPLSDARRTKALRLIDEPPTIDELGSTLLFLEPARRGEALREIAGFVAAGGHGSTGRQLFHALATRMAVPEDMARALLRET